MTESIKAKSTGLERFFDNRKDVIFYLSLLLYVLLSLLSFDAKLSTGGDDASYIARAFRLVNEGIFPPFQGPLYPIFLSPFVALFGIKVNLLKLLSLAFGIGFLSLFYFTLRNRINALVLSFTTMLIAVNALIIHYSSLTYNEIFHLFIQLLFLYFFFDLIQKLGDSDTVIKRDWKQWALLAFLSLLVVLSKNIGMALVLVVPFYLLFQKKFMASGIYLGMVGAFYMSFRFIRDLIWTVESPFSRQGQVFLYKDPYNFSKGKEDIFGFLMRLYENSHIYLSKHFMMILNIRETALVGEKDNAAYEYITYIVVILFVFALIRAFKNNKEMLFICLYTAFNLGISFIILQTRWDSDRLIILVIPFMILISIYALHELLSVFKKKYLGIAIYFIIGLLLFSNVQKSLSNIDILSMKKNLRGDRYHGYTTDWVNYLKMSEWVSDNMPEDQLVAVRKQTMSIIFSGGRDFYSIGKVPSHDADTLLNKLKDKGVTHVVMAQLRRDPNKKTEYTINTIQRYLAIIEQKYPGTFRRVHQIGGSEPAQLYQIYYR